MRLNAYGAIKVISERVDEGLGVLRVSSPVMVGDLVPLRVVRTMFWG